MNYCIKKYEDDSVVPASSLDNILTYSDNQLECQLHSFFTGNLLENLEEFYDELKEKINNKIYRTTDHLFLSTTINDCSYLYVTLDNSIRSNVNDHPLKDRIVELCYTVKNAISSLNNKCVILFSESCRPSFDGGVDDRTNEMSWFQIRNLIENLLRVYYLGECSNNEDPNGMAFGVSAFCTEKTKHLISNIYPRRLTTVGYGSGCIGIRMKTGEVVWGIHFPLDFKNKGTENMGAIVMTELCKTMDDYKGSVCAIGNFNTIRGQIKDTIVNSVAPDKKFILHDELTFFGSYFDTIKTDEEWVLLC